MDKFVKPVLGVTPREIEDIRRLHELRRALAQYVAEHEILPLQWVIEYNDLTEQINKREGKVS